MKVNLTICGIPQEPIEIGNNGIIGQLLAGNMAKAMSGLQAMEDEINEISPDSCQVNVIAEKDE